MASACPHESGTEESDKQPSLEEMKAQQAQFATEVLNWFLRQVGFENNCTKISVSSYEFCTDDFRKTALILCFIFRPVFRKLFCSLNLEELDAAGFEVIVMAYHVKRINASYILNFFGWVCYVLDFTTFCLVDHTDHVEVALRCLSNYSDVQYFHSQRGWTELQKLSEEYAKAYNVVEPILSVEDPKEKALFPFFEMVRFIILNAQDDLKEKWFLLTTHLSLIRKIYKDLLKEYSIDSILDSSGVMGGFSVRQKKSPKCSPEKSLQSPQKAAKTRNASRFWKEHTFDTSGPRGNLLNCFFNVNEQLFKDIKTPSFSNPYLLTKSHEFVEKVLENLSMDNNENSDRFLEINESNCMFIMTDKFLEERKASLDKILDSTPETLLSPETTEKKKKNPSLDNIVNKNIKAGNYIIIEGGLHVIYPDRCNIDDETCVNFYLEKDAFRFRDVPIKIQKLCRTILELRVKQEEIAEAKSELDDEQIMQSEPETEIPADVKRRIEMMINEQKLKMLDTNALESLLEPKEHVPQIVKAVPRKMCDTVLPNFNPKKYKVQRSLEIPETCQSIDDTRLQKYPENPEDSSSVQVDSDALSSNAQISNVQKQGESSQKQPRRYRKKSKKY